MSITFFLLLNFFLLTKHKLISSWLNVFDLNSASKISLLGGAFLISNIFLSYIFFFLEITSFLKFNLLIILIYSNYDLF
jgi:hypothetical protein